MNEKKVLRTFCKWVDDQFDFKEIIGGLAGAGIETVDRFVFSATIKAAYYRIPEEHRVHVLKVFRAIVKKDYESIESLSVDKAVILLKTPLGDAKEKIIVGGIIDMVFELLKVSNEES